MFTRLVKLDLTGLVGISKTRNGTERAERTERPGKIYAPCVTANVCVLTVCSTHTVPYKLQKSSMGSQESCL